ncbi:MAG TPA: ATP synthase F0 subunit B [Planctomycetes bacterium]|nr:ATP synthase F0 subunit B [Planctomycetota bacterium]
MRLISTFRFTALVLIAVASLSSGARIALAQADDEDPNSTTENSDPEESAAAPDSEDDSHESGGSGSHDLMDLSHQNPSDSLFDPGQWRSDLNIFTLIVFLLLIGVLMKFAWGPIAEGLDKREQGIANKIDEANRDAEAATARLAEYEAKLSDAESEGQALISKSQNLADENASRIRQEAEADADQQKQRAQADIDAARNVALNDLSTQSVDLAVHLASQIVGRELKQADHEALIQDALKQFSSSS